jgi:DNA primase catalytic core
MASRDEIDRVRSAVNILDVVTPYVALKRVGSVWKGLCPFHAEKTPSFQVNPDKGAWYCFGCSEGGDLFKFVERIENLGFNEALERLAAQAGVVLSNRRESPAEMNHREQMFLALEGAASFYQETLSRSPQAKQYLLDRGITHDAQVSFRLGYAGESFDALTEYLRKRRIDLRIATESGILARSDRQDAAPYDKLRGRIICPILDVHDRPIAFGGRLMEDIKERPKYLNTAETPLFSKGKTFFAMSRARKAMADLEFAIVVEGYFDVISAHQAGFTNVLATLGTALTSDHADILSRHVRRVVLAFDADAAGAKAAQRANAIFESKDFEVQVLDMPAGEDPDSLLRSGRTAEFRRAIDEALPIREFQLKAMLALNLSKSDLSERDRSAIFRRDIVPLLKSTKNTLERERYIKISAAMHPFIKMGAPYAEDEIRREVDGPVPRLAVRAVRFGGRVGPSPWTNSSVAAQNFVPPPARLLPMEEIVLRALITDEESIAVLIRERGVKPELFVTPVCRELARRMLSKGKSEDALLDSAATGDGGNGENSEVDRLHARLLAEGDGSAKTPGHAPIVVALSAELVKDSIQRLEREHILLLERELRLRANLDDDAKRELDRLRRKMHEQQSGSAGL